MLKQWILGAKIQFDQFKSSNVFFLISSYLHLSQYFVGQWINAWIKWAKEKWMCVSAREHRCFIKFAADDNNSEHSEKQLQNTNFNTSPKTWWLYYLLHFPLLNRKKTFIKCHHMLQHNLWTDKITWIFQPLKLQSSPKPRPLIIMNPSVNPLFEFNHLNWDTASPLKLTCLLANYNTSLVG